MRLRVALRGADATERLGHAIADVLEASDVILLFGELGAGKTTLVRGLVHALAEDVEVTSPTFTLRHEYETVPPVCHVDCWRLDQPSDLDELGLDEVVAGGGVLVIEWGELACARFGDAALKVQLDDALEGAARVAQLSEASSRWKPRLARLSEALLGYGLAAEVDDTDGATA